MKIIKYTERLLLKEATVNEAAFMLSLLNSEGWLKFIGDRGVRTIEDAAKYLQERVIPSYTLNGFGMYNLELKTTGEIIGMCGLIDRPTLEGIDIGFALLPDFEGKGYAFEAATAIMDFAKNDLKMDTIVAITTTDNLKSQQLLEKIGFKIIKTFKMEGDDAELYLYRIDNL